MVTNKDDFFLTAITNFFMQLLISKEKDSAKSIYICTQIVDVKISFQKTNRRNLSLYKNHGQSLSKRFALDKNHILSSVSFFYVAFPLHKCIITKKRLTYQNCLTYWIFLTWGIWFMSYNHPLLNSVNFNQPFEIPHSLSITFRTHIQC